MNIRDIARLTGVSVSTVSKIINGKADNIREETRERVLAVVRENNYVPYAGVKKAAGPTWLLGLLLRRERGRYRLAQSFAEHASAAGYGTLTLFASGAEEQQTALQAMSAHHVDGFVWDRSENAPEVTEEQFPELPPYLPLDLSGKTASDAVGFDYKMLGCAAAKQLLDQKHTVLCCLVHEDCAAARHFFEGCEQSVFNSGKQYASVGYSAVGENIEAISEQLSRATGFVCFDVSIASRVYQIAHTRHMKIPKDVSVVALAAECENVFLQPALTMIELPMTELGSCAAESILARLNGETEEETFSFVPHVHEGGSVDVPITVRGKKIVVVGSMNTDTMIRLPELPGMGETVSTRQLTTMPGGKGVNQAIGAALLGAEVFLIGRIGKDYEGGCLCECLRSHRVNIDGVTAGEEAVTGKAYVCVSGSGSSSIVVYTGANADLTPALVENQASAFDHAAFCLLQTELSLEVVQYTAALAQSKGARVILKPCAVGELPEELLSHVDYLIPNRLELTRICPGSGSIQEKAERLLDKGVGNVIVTLDKDGCYLQNREQSQYFPAADFTPVDTTGAADAFASALAVYLSRNCELTLAIRYAVYAAGYSITREGVPNSLVDKAAMDLYHP